MVNRFTHHMPEDDVLAIEPHFDSPSKGISFQTEIIRGALTAALDTDIRTDGKSLDFFFRLMSPQDQIAFDQFLKQRWLSGVSFYTPSWTNDFEVVGAISTGATSLTIKANGFGTWYNSVCGVRADERGQSVWKYTFYGVLLCTSDGYNHFLKLGKTTTTTVPTSGPAEPGVYVDNGDGTATLYLKIDPTDGGFPKTYQPSEVRLCSLIMRCRMAAPVLTYKTRSTHVLEARVPLQEVFFEGEALTSGSLSGYAIQMDDGQYDTYYWMLNAEDKLELFDGTTTYTVSLTGGAPPSGYLNYDDQGNFSQISLTGI